LYKLDIETLALLHDIKLLTIALCNTLRAYKSFFDWSPYASYLTIKIGIFLNILEICLVRLPVLN